MNVSSRQRDQELKVAKVMTLAANDNPSPASWWVKRGVLLSAVLAPILWTLL